MPKVLSGSGISTREARSLTASIRAAITQKTKTTISNFF